METNNKEKKKRIIFSHESDIDGLGNIVLAKIAFGEMEYELFPDPHNLTIKFQKYIEEGRLHQYDQIYITDLSLYPPVIQMVNEDATLREKIQIFDHHKGAVDAGCNDFEFSHVVIKDEAGKKKCGTELFYEYLCNHSMIKKTPLLDTFVELTRLEDTWEWTKEGDIGIMAHDLAVLFNSIGKEEYVSRLITKLSHSSEGLFQYDEEEKQLIANKKEECSNAISTALNEIEYMVDEFGNKFGIVFTSYEFRNEIPEFIRNSGNPEKIKYMIIAAMDKGENGQKSYRLIEDGFDVNEVAKFHGGGGPTSAAAVPITKEQKEKALSLSKKEGLAYLAYCKYSN